MLQSLFPRIGFRYASLVMALIFLFLLLLANILIRARLPPRPGGSVWPDFRILRDKTFALTTAGVFFVEWGLFVPLSFISSYALHEGINPAFAYQILAVINAGSVFGRWLPGYVADRIGRFNTMIATVAMCLVSVLGLWLTAGGNIAQLCVFGVLFGFGSGSNISLTPVCVGQLCQTEVFGRWYATAYTIVSFGYAFFLSFLLPFFPLTYSPPHSSYLKPSYYYPLAPFPYLQSPKDKQLTPSFPDRRCLTGIPIAGQILTVTRGSYWGLILFAGLCYVMGLACFTAARAAKVGWDPRKIY